MTRRIPFRVKPMLATLIAEPFHRPGWVYEEKYDGDRILAYKEEKDVRLISRGGKDLTARFPRVAAAIRALQPASLLLDGEIVIFDRQKISRFQLLQRLKGEPVYAVFDCLYRNGKDLRSEPLSLRRAVTEESLVASKVMLPSHKLSSNGLKAFEMAKRHGYEGLVAKDLSSSYVEGRSTRWLKVKIHQEDEFVIAGYTKPAGSRQYFGALLLGAYHRGHLQYVGKVGTGFDQRALADLHRKFQPLLSSKPALIDPPREKGVAYLVPRLIAQILFHEWTADRKLRQPVYLGLRDDKRPEEVSLPEA